MEKKKQKIYDKWGFIAKCNCILTFYEDFSGQSRSTLTLTNTKGHGLSMLAAMTHEARCFNNALFRPFITGFLNYCDVSGRRNRQMLRHILNSYINSPYFYKTDYYIYFKKIQNYYKEEGIEAYTENLAAIFNTSKNPTLFLPIAYIPGQVERNTYHLKKALNSVFLMFMEYVCINRSHK